MTKSGLPILALNSGSSSLKFGLYRVGPSVAALLVSGEAEWKGAGAARFRARDANGAQVLADETALSNQQDALIRLARFLADTNQPTPAAIGHRIVHGGTSIRQHCLIDDAVLEQLKAASIFAPLHVPPALAVLRHSQELFGGIGQVACLDTAFHAGLPDVARILPLAKDLQSQGIERFGFHGLSCESIVRQLGRGLPERLIIAHLGNGASITAVRSGRSVDTSMGLTPTGGVVMGTRCGDLDPGVLIYLMRERSFDAAKLEEMVDRRSGLLGISGISSDMRDLHEAAASNPDAKLAIEMFCYSVRKHIAAMTAVLDGADLLVFTGGIGEHDVAVRARICENLSSLGIVLDSTRNASQTVISADTSRCLVRVLASQEDAEIARHAWALTAPSRQT